MRDPVTGHCVAGFHETSWGCAKNRRTGFGADDSGNRKAVWLGAVGLGISAAIMIAMGFHKPPPPVRRRRT
jgi:hypothetical protein